MRRSRRSRRATGGSADFRAVEPRMDLRFERGFSPKSPPRRRLACNAARTGDDAGMRGRGGRLVRLRVACRQAVRPPVSRSASRERIALRAATGGPGRVKSTRASRDASRGAREATVLGTHAVPEPCIHGSRRPRTTHAHAVHAPAHEDAPDRPRRAHDERRRPRRRAADPPRAREAAGSRGRSGHLEARHRRPPLPQRDRSRAGRRPPLDLPPPRGLAARARRRVHLHGSRRPRGRDGVRRAALAGQRRDRLPLRRRRAGSQRDDRPPARHRARHGACEHGRRDRVVDARDRPPRRRVHRGAAAAPLRARPRSGSRWTGRR